MVALYNAAGLTSPVLFWAKGVKKWLSHAESEGAVNARPEPRANIGVVDGVSAKTEVKQYEALRRLPNRRGLLFCTIGGPLSYVTYGTIAETGAWCNLP